MSNIETPDSDENKSEKPDIVQSPRTKSKVETMFQELEIMALQKGSRNSLDLTKLNEEQINKVLDTMAENEKNAFNYHIKKLEANKDIELRKIDASIIDQKTRKFLLIGGIVFVLPAITLLILFFKETYFIPWLTFVTGIIGGFGLSKISSSILKGQVINDSIKEDDKRE